ncbi:MAG: hypothetical protein H0U16_06195 [Actinobacteria bacterium]|nr:hypothetical protein [Actinomycetota bacterium]
MFAYLDLGVILFVLGAGFALGVLCGWNSYGSWGSREEGESCDVVDLTAYRLQVVEERSVPGRDI